MKELNMSKSQPSVSFDGNRPTQSDLKLSSLQVKYDLSTELSEQKKEIAILKKEIDQEKAKLEGYISNLKYLVTGIIVPIVIGVVIFYLTHLPRK